MLIVAMTAFAAVIGAQTTKGKTNKRPTVKVTPPSTPAPTPQATPDPEPPKRNERPGEVTTAPTPTPKGQSSGPHYSYVFTRPGFTYSRVTVEHDSAGKGKISFQKSSFDEPIVDPIDLSPTTMKNLTEALAALNYLDSTEEYQHARDYSNMGNVEFTLKNAGRERTMRFNWTDNKHARVIMDEYRRISNEYTWRFEIDLARQNQPLLTPSMMEAIDAYIDRKEISDPMHLVPFLTQLSTDERLPLMARNRATKIIKVIEKVKK